MTTRSDTDHRTAVSSGWGASIRHYYSYVVGIGRVLVMLVHQQVNTSLHRLIQGGWRLGFSNVLWSGPYLNWKWFSRFSRLVSNSEKKSRSRKNFNWKKQVYENVDPLNSFPNNCIPSSLVLYSQLNGICNGWDVCMNGTTGVPKSVLR